MTATEVEHRYRPRGACFDLMLCRDPEVLMSGPAGTGKSRACLEKLLQLALNNPGMRGLIVRKTAASMTSTALVTWREFVIKEAELNGTVTYYGGSQAEPPQYRFSNGSRVMVGGMDRATKIMSSEYDAIYVQEAIELLEDDWEALSTRLRHGIISFQQLLADTNPDTDIHWLNQRCNSGVVTRLESRHADNPILVDDHGAPTERGKVYLDRLDQLTGVRRARLRDGRWVAAEGIIWEGWEPLLHLVSLEQLGVGEHAQVDQWGLPWEWVRWWSIDFGYTNPFVCQRWAEDPDGRLILYREHYATRTLVEDHARIILRDCTLPLEESEEGIPGRHLAEVEGERRLWQEPQPRAVICDHDAEDRATLLRHLGRGTTAAKKTVLDGLQAVAARLKPAGDGRPRLMLLRDAVASRDPELVEAKKPACTQEEIPGYIWAPAQPGRPPKEEPLKADDHGCDALRYCVANRDLRGRTRVRFM